MSIPVLRAPDTKWGASAVHALSVTATVCALIFVIGLFAEPQRAWSGFLIGFHALVGLAVAGPMGLAFFHLSGGKWARSLEAVPRAMAAALPAAAALGVVLVFGVHSLFEWSHASAVEGDAILEAKSAYLNVPFFTVRLVAFFVLWYVGARAVLRASSEATGDAADQKRRRLRAAAFFLFLFAPTWSLASIDWLQSLDPHWFSAIYALITISGVAVAGLAACIILIAAVDTRDQVTEAQYGDLGALLLSFALFWGYIWYCQYLLIWYTNLPEETPWYIARLAGDWGLLTKVACVLCSALPFVLLLFRKLRRSRRALVRIAALVLVGRLVDLLVLAGPPLMGASARLGLWELAPIAGSVALFFLLAIRALRRTAVGARSGAETAQHVVTHSAPATSLAGTASR